MPEVAVWFMFDRHLFSHVKGTDVKEISDKLINLHREDQWCGSHSRWTIDGESIEVAHWHSRPKVGELNAIVIAEQVKQVFNTYVYETEVANGEVSTT